MNEKIFMENNSLHDKFNLMEQQTVYDSKNVNGKKEKLNDKRFDENTTPKKQNYLNAKLSNDRFQLSVRMENINWDYINELKKYSDFLSISLLKDLEYIETSRQNDYQAHESFDRISCSELTFPEVIGNGKAITVCPERNVIRGDNREKEASRNDNQKIIIEQEESAIDCESSFQDVEHVNKNLDSKTSFQHKTYKDLTLPPYINYESIIHSEQNLQEKSNSKYSLNENICMQQSTLTPSNNGIISTDNSNAHSIEIITPKYRNLDYARCITNKYKLYEDITSNAYTMRSNILYHDKNNQSPILSSKKRLTNTENSLKSENYTNRINRDIGINGASSLFSIRDPQEPNLDCKNFLKYNCKPENVIVGRNLNNYQQRPICLRTHEFNVFNTKNKCSCIDTHNHDHIGVYNTRETCFGTKRNYPDQTTKPPPMSSSLPNIRSPYFLPPNYSHFRFC